MENYDYNISLNGKQFDVRVTEHVEGEKTLYDVQFEDRTLTIYKKTRYTPGQAMTRRNSVRLIFKALANR